MPQISKNKDSLFHSHLQYCQLIPPLLPFCQHLSLVPRQQSLLILTHIASLPFLKHSLHPGLFLLRLSPRSDVV